MGNSAYIKLVEGSTIETATLEELKKQLDRYVEMTTHTGEQLGWTYAEAAFPYTIVEKEEGKEKWFYLKGKNPNYRFIVLGVNDEKNFQVVLPQGATQPDKSKAVEFAKYLGKAFKAEVHLFNDRTMYYNPRKV